ncbi:MAG: hypothetical protein AAFW83_05275 [Pseudomonadota bacterium]
MRVRAILFLIWLMIGSAGCAALGPVSTMDQRVNAPLLDWDRLALQKDPDCYNLHTKYSKWGTFIGCQSIEIFDIRDRRAFDFFARNLNEQSCQNMLSSNGQRNYIRTGEPFLFIDKVTKNANVWYVPGNYFSDGVSTPDFVREILPGAILDTESPRTLSAALFHDRYFCLYDYTRIAWDKTRDNYPSHIRAMDPVLEANNAGPHPAVPIAYRRRGCANRSFRDGLRTAGASSFVSTVFRRMVGFVNPGSVGYCPQRIHAQALARLDQQLTAMLGYGDFGTPGRTQLPGCRAKEPVVLCLANPEALWFLASRRPDDYGDASDSLITDEWRQVFTRILCYDLQAQAVRKSRWDQTFSFDQAQAADLCASINIAELRTENEDIREPMAERYPLYRDRARVIASPFRAGDFIVEAAVMLIGPEGPADFLSTIASSRTVDFAMLSLAIWNQENGRERVPDKKDAR